MDLNVEPYKEKALDATGRRSILWGGLKAMRDLPKFWNKVMTSCLILKATDIDSKEAFWR